MFPTHLRFFFSILGEPLPSVVWYMDDKLLDDTYQQTYEGVVKNDLTVRRLERVHTLSKLRCLASNNNLTRPVETSVTLKMLCKYISVANFAYSVRNLTIPFKFVNLVLEKECLDLGLCTYLVKLLTLCNCLLKRPLPERLMRPLLAKVRFA